MDKKVSENFIILSLKPAKGTFIISGNYLNYGILGAILMDLVLNDKIEIEGKKIKVKNARGITGIEFYDRFLKQIGDMESERTISFWLRKMAFRSAWYKKEILNKMSNSGMLRMDRKRFLGIPYKVYFPSDISKNKKLVFRFKDIILYNKEPDEWELMILGLIQACHLQRALSADRNERRKLRRLLKTYLKENPVASGVSRFIMESQAAISASIAASVVISSAVATR